MAMTSGMRTMLLNAKQRSTTELTMFSRSVLIAPEAARRGGERAGRLEASAGDPLPPHHVVEGFDPQHRGSSPCAFLRGTPGRGVPFRGQETSIGWGRTLCHGVRQVFALHADQ
jgi:hypothetical protein